MSVRFLWFYIAVSCALFSCASWKRYQVGQLMQRCSLDLGAVRIEKIDFDENAFNILRDSLPIQDMLKQIMMATLSGQPIKSTLAELLPQIYARWPAKELARLSLRAELLIRNPNSRDTLWIRDLREAICWNSVTMPYRRSADAPQAIAPGQTTHPITIEIPLSKEILRQPLPDSAEIKGDLLVSLTQQSQPIAFSFSKKQPVPDLAKLNQALSENLFDLILNQSFH